MSTRFLNTNQRLNKIRNSYRNRGKNTNPYLETKTTDWTMLLKLHKWTSEERSPIDDGIEHC